VNVTSSVSLFGGTCEFFVDDDHGGAQPVAVTVGPFGSPEATPNSLTLNTVNMLSAPIMLTEAGYSGQFTPSSTDCSGIATFAPAQGTNFTITEAGAGTCHILFSDDHGGSTSATIIVYGALMLSPTTITFGDINVMFPVGIDEPNYTGNFTVANSTCGGPPVIATVGTPMGPGPSTSLNVTSVAQGSCLFDVQDTDGQSVQETVNVGPFGPPTPSTTQINLNTGGPLTGTFTISETGYTGNFTLTPSSACATVASVSPGVGNQSTTFTVTALGIVGTCGIRIADDLMGTSNVEVEVATGTMSVTPASLFFATTTSPEQDVAASDPGATAFTCASTDTTDVTATITVQNTGSATCAVIPTNANPSFQGTLQVNFGDSNQALNAVVQVGVVTQPLSKHHRPAPGGSKRPLPAPHATRPPVVPARPLPIPGGQTFELSAQQLTLLAAGGRQTIEANVFDYRDALVATNNAPNVVQVMVTPGSGSIRLITFVAMSPGVAMVRIDDDRGNSRYVRVVVQPPAADRPAPGSRPGGPP
jgi:hypothetical protein